MIGELLSPTLVLIEDSLWEFEAKKDNPPNYTMEGFRAATKIFMSALLDKMWVLQEKEGINKEDREAMATACGLELRDIIKKYTNIDTHKLYEL